MPCPSVPEFLDRVKSAHGLTSDYQLAEYLHLTRAAVSSLRKEHSCFSDETSLKIAAALDLHPCFVLACVHAQKEKANPEANKAWRDVARQYEKLMKHQNKKRE